MRKSRGRKARITEEMKLMLNCVPTELNHYFNSKEVELKSLFGLMYSISNNFNTDTIKLSKRKISEFLGKIIDSSKLIVLTNQLKEKGLITRINSTSEGTIYKLILHDSQQKEIMETEETKVMNETVENRNSTSIDKSFFELLLNELKGIKEEISTLREDNDKIKEGMRILNNKLNNIKNEIPNTSILHEDNDKIKEGMKILNRKLNNINSILNSNFQETPNIPSLKTETSTLKIESKSEIASRTSGNASKIVYNALVTETPIEVVETRSNALKIPNVETSAITVGTPNQNDVNMNEPLSKTSSRSLIETIISDSIPTDSEDSTNENTSRTSGNTPRINVATSNEELHSQTTRTPSEDVKTPNTKLSEMTFTELVLLRRERIDNGMKWNEIREEIDRRMKTLDNTSETSKDTSKTSTNIPKTSENTPKTSGNALRIASTDSSEEFRGIELNAMREQAKRDKGCFTEVGRYQVILVNKKDRLIRNKESYDWIDKELLRIQNENALYPKAG